MHLNMLEKKSANIHCLAFVVGYANLHFTVRFPGQAWRCNDQKVARHTGSDEREIIGQLIQKISLHLMRGNATMIASRRRPEADFLPPELDGIE